MTKQKKTSAMEGEMREQVDMAEEKIEYEERGGCEGRVNERGGRKW